MLDDDFGVTVVSMVRRVCTSTRVVHISVNHKFEHTDNKRGDSATLPRLIPGCEGDLTVYGDYKHLCRNADRIPRRR